MALTQKTIAAATAGKNRRLYSDGGGLFLQVTPGGVKSWLLRFQLRGRRRDMGLGSIKLVSLEEARQRALDARKLRRDGTDPIDARRDQAALAVVEEAKRRTFDEVAAEYLELNASKWRSADHARQWRASRQRR